MIHSWFLGPMCQWKTWYRQKSQVVVVIFSLHHHTDILTSYYSTNCCCKYSTKLLLLCCVRVDSFFAASARTHIHLLIFVSSAKVKGSHTHLWAVWKVVWPSDRTCLHRTLCHHINSVAASFHHTFTVHYSNRMCNFVYKSYFISKFSHEPVTWCDVRTYRSAERCVFLLALSTAFLTFKRFININIRWTVRPCAFVFVCVVVNGAHTAYY